MTARRGGSKPPRHGWAPAEPLRRPVLFVNPRSGGGKAGSTGLVDRARDRGVETIVLGRDAILEALVADAVARGADGLGMAGGDGSLAVVATAARAHALPFVCIPAGTRNHFAFDVGVDRSDLLGALDAFSDGIERQIDVAEVNRRMFLNNVSLGIYGDAVQQPGYRDAKLRTLLDTAHAVLGPSRAASRLQLLDDLGHLHDEPAVVLVSNNPYALNRPLVTGSRPTLSSGRLGILVLDAPGDRHRAPGRAWTATSVEISASERLHAGIDGEAVELDPPLEVVVRPAALRVRISSRHPGLSPSGLLGRERSRPSGDEDE